MVGALGHLHPATLAVVRGLIGIGMAADSPHVADQRPRDTTARSLAGLDWVNFFLADVASGLGPFLAIYLLTKRDWNAASIGVVLTIGGIAGLVAQTPAGAIIDASGPGSSGQQR